MEKDITIKDLIAMGYNIEALEEYYQGIYTEDELKQILNGELDIMYTTGDLFPPIKKSGKIIEKKII